jgi:hypothetical protein
MTPYPSLNLNLTITNIGGVALHLHLAVGQDPAHRLGENVESHELPLRLRHRLLEGGTIPQRPLVLDTRTSDGAVIHLRLARENDLLMTPVTVDHPLRRAGIRGQGRRRRMLGGVRED